MRKSNYLRIRVTDEMLNDLQRIANQEHRTLSDCVRLYLMKLVASSPVPVEAPTTKRKGAKK
jgi:antitoxin component of RelBE/YafQ-DinJ toxin-antitoxin module